MLHCIWHIFVLFVAMRFWTPLQSTWKVGSIVQFSSDLNSFKQMILTQNVSNSLFSSFTAVCVTLFRFSRLLSYSHIDNVIRTHTHIHPHQNGIRVIWFDGLELLVDLVIRYSVAKNDPRWFLFDEPVTLIHTRTRTHTQLLLSCPLSSRVEINFNDFQITHITSLFFSHSLSLCMLAMDGSNKCLFILNEWWWWWWRWSWPRVCLLILFIFHTTQTERN